MARETKQKSAKKEIEELLNRQTAVILGAASEKTTAIDDRLNGLEIRFDGIEKRIDKMELRISQKFDKLMTTLDKFLKRLTDIEDEFTMMKLDINRLKKAMREKLGVEIG